MPQHFQVLIQMILSETNLKKLIPSKTNFKMILHTIFFLDEDLPLPPPPSLPHEEPPNPSMRSYVFNRNSGGAQPKSTHFDLEAELECLPASNKITRRYSDESLVSNPAMLHTGTLIPSYPDYPVLSNNGNGNQVKFNQVSPVKSPEPNRPAPVLKPQIGRKPSIDKALLAKKLQQPVDTSQHVSRQLLPSNG